MDNNQFFSAEEEQFSNDPQENLQIENEILRMKVKAELGGAYEGSENLPPEMENEFLKNILAFEHQYANTKLLKIAELLGNPVIKEAADLDDNMIRAELEDLEELLEQKSIIVEFVKPRDDRFKYKFITEELLEHETDDMQVEGLTKHFTYEEFHPDHEMEIEQQSISFLSDWFDRNVGAHSLYLNERFIQPDGNILARDELAKKFRIVFDAYISFDECQYTLGEIKFNLHESADGANEGTGFAEGTVKYIAALEDREQKNIEGLFKFYFLREYGNWRMFFFYLTGFNM